MTKEPVRILVVGGGCVGMYTALRLQRLLKPYLRRAREGREDGVRIDVLNPGPYMTYRPLLPEAAAGTVSPRHAVVPLRRVLPHCRIVVGEARAVDHARRVATAQTPAAGDGTGDLRIPYDELVLAPGSVLRVPPAPGLADHGIGLRTVEEAVGLRHHVLEQLDIAATTRDPEIRDAALTFVFVGGGHAGVGGLAELEDMARHACRYHRTVRPEDLRWVLVEETGGLLPEADGATGRYAARELRRRAVDVRLGTRLESYEGRVAVLSDGSRHPCRTLVWTAGTAPHPLLAATGFPLDRYGRVRCDAALRVDGTEHAWAAGDAAAVPCPGAGDGAGRTEGGTGDCAPNARHALHQARVLADNLVATLRGGEPAAYAAAGAVGSTASLGLHKGVAHVRGRDITGRAAWLLHRAHHLGRMPTPDRRVRALAEWTLAGLFGREVVSLGPAGRPGAGSRPAAGNSRRLPGR